MSGCGGFREGVFNGTPIREHKAQQLVASEKAVWKVWRWDQRDLIFAFTGGVAVGLVIGFTLTRFLC